MAQRGAAVNNYTIGAVTIEELSQVTDMVKTVFDKFMAPSYSEEGIQRFHYLIAAETIQNRLQQNSFMLVAKKENQIIGVIEIYYINHVLLLFTAENWHGCGIGRSLVEAGINKCSQEHEELHQITVGAFKLSVPFYEKMGFVMYDQEQTINGIRFTPMLKTF